jgi:hypothetical protein
MPAFDIIADTQPQQPLRVTRHYGRKTVAQLRTELQALDAALYTNAVVNNMTYDDLVYAVQITPEVTPEPEPEPEEV